MRCAAKIPASEEAGYNRFLKPVPLL